MLVESFDEDEAVNQDVDQPTALQAQLRGILKVKKVVKAVIVEGGVAGLKRLVAFHRNRGG